MSLISKDSKSAKTRQSIKLSAEKQIIVLIVAIVTLIGASIMLAMHTMQDIKFNNNVINEKTKAQSEYATLIRNVGICKENKDKKNKNGTYTEAELKSCNPNTLSAEEVPNTLRYNILYQTAKNADLESVGRESLSLCYDSAGKRIDFSEKQKSAENEQEKLLYADLNKKCSAIRVIPEALPSKQNTEALLSSLNKIMLLSSWQPEKISPDGEATPLDIPGLGFMPLKFSTEANPEIVYSIIENIEKSIRNIDINRASISWGGRGRIEFSANATAYYAEHEQYQEKTTTVHLESGNKKSSKSSKTTKKSGAKK